MDDLQLLEEIVRHDRLPTRQELAPARADLLDAMHTAARPGRREVLIASLATAGLAVAVLAIGGLTSAASGPSNGDRAGSGPAGGATTAGAGPSAADVSFRLVADSPETAQATADRLSTELDAALHKAAPGARWDGPAPRLKGWDSVDAGSAGQLFNGGGTVELGGKSGSLGLIVDTDQSILACVPKQADCTVTTAPNGAKLVALTITAPGMPGLGDPHTQLQSRVALPDGRVLVIVHSNDVGPDGTPPNQWRVPLTREQVTAIAVEIGAKIKA
jgi:hypothetical protein